MEKIFINPGHGYKSNGVYDPGAVGPTGYQEAVCVQTIGGLLASKLQSVGAGSKVYQHGDLNSVGAGANTWGADLFVSIHCNSNIGTPGTGTETYHYPGSTRGNALSATIQTELVNAFGRTDRGVKTANFQVLRDTIMPAALVEMLFINNPTEETMLKSAAWQEKAAEALATGICRYIGILYPPAPGPWLVRVTDNALNIRSGPGTDYAITGVIRDMGVYTIVEQNGTWGRLKSGAGWISLVYTVKV